MKTMLNLSLRLALISAVAALALAQVADYTAGPIAAAARAASLRAIRQVLPAYDNEPDQDVVRIILAPGDTLECFRGRRDGVVSGCAYKAVTQLGYSGEIDIMLGLETDGKVSGVRLLQHAETPGLGAKYAEPALLDSYYRGHGLADTDWRVAKDGGDLDAVTGATVTGRALADAIQRGLEQYQAHRDEILGAATEGGQP
jgi:electron transport complex protein RnfG